jgi:hypothetical protein
MRIEMGLKPMDKTGEMKEKQGGAGSFKPSVSGSIMD